MVNGGARSEGMSVRGRGESIVVVTATRTKTGVTELRKRFSVHPGGGLAHDPLHEPAGLERSLKVHLIDGVVGRARDRRGSLPGEFFDSGAPADLENGHTLRLGVQGSRVGQRLEALQRARDDSLV